MEVNDHGDYRYSKPGIKNTTAAKVDGKFLMAYEEPNLLSSERLLRIL